MGIIESAMGISLVVGPMLGAFFYSLGGYMLPFIAYGIFFLLFIIFFSRGIIKKINESVKELQMK